MRHITENERLEQTFCNTNSLKIGEVLSNDKTYCQEFQERLQNTIIKCLENGQIYPQQKCTCSLVF